MFSRFPKHLTSISMLNTWRIWLEIRVWALGRGQNSLYLSLLALVGGPGVLVSVDLLWHLGLL